MIWKAQIQFNYKITFLGWGYFPLFSKLHISCWKFVLLEGMKDTVAKKFFQEVIHHIRGLLFKPDDPKQFYAYILGNNDSNKSLGKDIHIKYASSFVLCFFFFWPPPPPRVCLWLSTMSSAAISSNLKFIVAKIGLNTVWGPTWVKASAGQ